MPTESIPWNPLSDKYGALWRPGKIFDGGGSPTPEPIGQIKFTLEPGESYSWQAVAELINLPQMEIVVVVYSKDTDYDPPRCDYYLQCVGELVYFIDETGRIFAPIVNPVAFSGLDSFYTAGFQKLYTSDAGLLIPPGQEVVERVWNVYSMPRFEESTFPVIATLIDTTAEDTSTGSDGSTIFIRRSGAAVYGLRQLQADGSNFPSYPSPMSCGIHQVTSISCRKNYYESGGIGNTFYSLVIRVMATDESLYDRDYTIKVNGVVITEGVLFSQYLNGLLPTIGDMEFPPEQWADISAALESTTWELDIYPTEP